MVHWSQNFKHYQRQTICRTTADVEVQLTMLAMPMHSPNSPSNKNRYTNLQVMNVSVETLLRVTTTVKKMKVER